MPNPTRQPAKAAPRVVTPDLVRSAFACIPPDVDRDTWVKLGMAAKAELGEAGRDLWDQWSQGGKDYSETDARDVWRSIKAGGKVTVGTLFAIAKQYGFTFPDAGAGSPPVPSKEGEAERARLSAKKESEREAETAKLRSRAERAARNAVAMWSKGRVDVVAAYNLRKGVGMHGTRALSDLTLMVPMCNAAGQLLSLQLIAATKPTAEEEAAGKRDKNFLPGTSKPGLMYVIGELAGARCIAICEGFATAASVHEATGLPTVVAFDAGNLVHVARELRALYPGVMLLICGDDDRETEARTGKNTGRECAAKAVRAVHSAEGPAGAVFPEGLPAGGKDWNDLAAHAGLEVVRLQIERAAAAPQVPKPRRAAKSAPDEAMGDELGAEQGGEAAEAPEAPAFVPFRKRDHYTLDESGVWVVTWDKQGNERSPLWLSDPLYVTAITRDESDNGYGYLIEFGNRDNKHCVCTLPAALFNGDGAEWSAMVRSMGLRMAAGTTARNLLGAYIDSRNPDARAVSTSRIGWNGAVYVLPSRCIGTDPQGRRFVFQAESGLDDQFRRRGTGDAWRSTVAPLCVGNSRMLFIVSCAFGGALLPLADEPTRIFHFVGATTVGKSTGALVGASVWGPPSFRQQWRASDSGLESVCLQHNNTLLLLDEISQMDSRLVGPSAYMICNEKGRIRSRANLTMQKSRSWRLLVVSNGEKSLTDYLMESGIKPNEGQLVRMPTIPADAGKGIGMFECLHGIEVGDTGGKALADRLTQAAAENYGSVGLEWLQWLADHQDEAKSRARTLMKQFASEWVPANAHPQVWRVATGFALVAAAGELATEAGVTGWQAGEAEWGARTCFDAWLRARGHAGDGLQARAFRQVRAELEKGGDSCYTWIHRAMEDHRNNTVFRGGFRRMVDERGEPVKLDAATDFIANKGGQWRERTGAMVEFLVFRDHFCNVLCKGYDPDMVAQLLKARGHLKHEKDRNTNKHRLPGMPPTAVYHILPSIFEDDM